VLGASNSKLYLTLLETMSCQEVHADFCGEVTWNRLAWDLIGLPASIQFGLAVFTLPLGRWWSTHAKSRFVRGVRQIVGDDELSEKSFRYPIFLKTCFLMEIILSVWFATSWALRTYSHEVSLLDGLLDQVFCGFFIITYILNAARNNFSLYYTLSWSSVITVLTVVPTYSRDHDSTNRWFSFGYLRASNAIIAISKIEKMGALKDVGDISRMYIQLSLRTFTLVTCLVGTVFVLEVLGDPEALQDQFIETNMGGLSVLQLTYWIFTTISTVGYGDYAPKTVLCRLFIIVAILVGVCFFTEEINEVVRVYRMESSGRGRYHIKGDLDHVVLIGGGVSQFSSVMQSLMHEVFAAEQERWPDLVIMASAEEPEALRQAIKGMPKLKRNHIRYYMGDPTDPEDMARVRMDEADLVIVIPSLLAADMNLEDEANILRGLAAKNCYPQINLRLMLLRASNKKVAVQVGFPPNRCFSINEQKSGLFALACYCRGLGTMITHFIMANDESESALLSARDKAKLSQPWAVEYKEGRQFHVMGFMINSRFARMSFSQFAIYAVKHNVTPIAVQIDGKIFLAPDHTLSAGEIVFALVRNSADVTDLREPKSDWRAEFKDRQTNAQEHVKKSFFQKHKQLSLVFESQSQTRPSTFSSLPAATAGSQIVPTLRSDKDKQEELTHRLAMMDHLANIIANEGGHYILVLLQGGQYNWLAVQDFLSSLRADHLPFHIPILVVLPPQHPSPSLLVDLVEKFPRTAFVRATGKITTDDLKKAGMHAARCIALLAGNAGDTHTSDRRMVDGSGITLMACVESELRENNAANVHCFLELHQQESVRFLSPFFHNDLGSHDYDPSQSFTNHARFANGNIFTASCFGATVARSFNMPGIVELMEAITLGSINSQTSFPWQTICPEGFDGRTYGDLVQHFLEGYNAVCLGLFRLCDFSGPIDSTGPRFVITCPDHQVELRSSDWCFVLGNKEFGEDFFTKQMLVGAEAAPSKDAPDGVSGQRTTYQARSCSYEPSQQPIRDIDLWQASRSFVDDTPAEALLPQLRTPTPCAGQQKNNGPPFMHFIPPFKNLSPRRQQAGGLFGRNYN